MNHGFGPAGFEQDLEYLLDEQAPMVLRVMTVHGKEIGLPVADTCCTGADA